MRIAKVGFGNAKGMRLFIDKEDAACLIRRTTDMRSMAMTSAFIAELAITVKTAEFFLHGILPCF